MNPDPETLFSLLDQRPAVPMAPSASLSPATTDDGDPDPTQPDSIVGGPFLWVSGSAVLSLS